VNAARIRIGTSGWSYAHWRGVLYERGTKDLLGRYIREFDTVELNASFYRWPQAARFAAWRDRLPEGFAMTVKAPRGLTHARRLQATPAWMARIDEGLAALGERSGPLLAQLPPTLERDDALLHDFLAALPARARPVMELRHPSWDAAEVYDLLERRGAAYCVMDGPGLATIPRVTAPFAYVRLHGPASEAMYAGGYSADALATWAARIRAWADAGTEVFVYFNNDLGGHAVHDARTLQELTG
jgi:uncharacterized protein YecE (DUF72 family)